MFSFTVYSIQPTHSINLLFTSGILLLPQLHMITLATYAPVRMYICKATLVSTTFQAPKILFHCKWYCLMSSHALSLSSSSPLFIATNLSMLTAGSYLVMAPSQAGLNCLHCRHCCCIVNMVKAIKTTYVLYCCSLYDKSLQNGLTSIVKMTDLATKF